MDKNEQLAWVWRSKARCNPLFISTGHRVGLDSALAWVQRCMNGYRLPGPARWCPSRGCRGIRTSGVYAMAGNPALIDVHCR